MSNTVEWLPTIVEELNSFINRAIVSGHEDDGPLWVIRARFNNDIIPGKLAVNTHVASITSNNMVKKVFDIEVACADATQITWLLSSNGSVPSNAIVAGYIRSTGERLYVGRALYLGQLINGKIEPSLKSLIITYEGHIIKIENYEVMCTVAPAETNPDGTEPET